MRLTTKPGFILCESMNVLYRYNNKIIIRKYNYLLFRFIYNDQHLKIYTTNIVSKYLSNETRCIKYKYLQILRLHNNYFVL